MMSTLPRRSVICCGTVAPANQVGGNTRGWRATPLRIHHLPCGKLALITITYITMMSNVLLITHLLFGALQADTLEQFLHLLHPCMH